MHKFVVNMDKNDVSQFLGLKCEVEIYDWVNPIVGIVQSVNDDTVTIVSYDKNLTVKVPIQRIKTISTNLKP